MVRKSFKTCGISNALDGTEDDEVYADDMPELADDDMAMEDEFETDSERDDDWKLHSWSQQTKRLHHLNKSFWPTAMIFVHELPVICICW